MGLERVIALGVAGIARVLSGARPLWLGCEPTSTQRIYFANHSSHLDAVVLWTAFPPELRARVRPVAAQDYWDASRFRRYLAGNVFRSVLIPRPGKGAPLRESATAAIEKMGDVLSEGQDSLIFFPEGTRGGADGIGAFKSGLYHLAKRHPEVELVPVYMENLSRILPKGEFLPVPILGSVSIGRPIRLDAGESKQEFLLRARRELCELGGVSDDCGS